MKNIPLIFLIVSTCLMFSFIFKNEAIEETQFPIEDFIEAPDNFIFEDLSEESEPDVNINERINYHLSSETMKCSSSVITNSRAIYYLRLNNADEEYRKNPEVVKEKLNKLSERIEQLWISNGNNYIVELVLDSQKSDSVLAVSTNGKISFTRY